MKNIKTILSCYLAIHIICLLIVNIISFTKFDDSKNGLNKVGNFCATQINIKPAIEPVSNMIGLYTNLTGINRGYEFFSPNVSKGSLKLIFVSDKGEELSLLKSIESKMKLLTATLYFSSNLSEKKSRDKITKSICNRLFNKYPDVNKISIYADLSIINTLENSSKENYILKKDKILVSNITKK